MHDDVQLCGNSSSDVVAILSSSLSCVCPALIVTMSSFALKVLHAYYAAEGFTLTKRQHPQHSDAIKAVFADLKNPLVRDRRIATKCSRLVTG